MKLSVIASILFTNFVNIYGVRFLFRDPSGIAEQYLVQEQAFENSGVQSWKRPQRLVEKNNAFKKETCLSSVNAVQFWLVSPNYDAEYRSIRQEREATIRKINDFYDSAGNTILVDLQIPFVQRGRSVLKQVIGFACLLQYNAIEMAIADVFVGDFYIMGETRGSKQFEGFVQDGYFTTIDPRVSRNQKEMELDFKISQLAYDIGRSQFRKNIHTLSNFNKFRACASVYTLLPGNTVNPDLENIVRELQNKSIPANAIKSSTGQDFEFPANKNIDIIACAVNTSVGENPQFYLAADQTTIRAAYVLIEQNSGHYSVQLRVTGVLGMENLF